MSLPTAGTKVGEVSVSYQKYQQSQLKLRKIIV